MKFYVRWMSQMIMLNLILGQCNIITSCRRIIKFRKNRRKIELQDIKIGMHLTYPNHFPLWMVLNNTRTQDLEKKLTEQWWARVRVLMDRRLNWNWGTCKKLFRVKWVDNCTEPIRPLKQNGTVVMATSSH